MPTHTKHAAPSCMHTYERVSHWRMDETQKTAKEPHSISRSGREYRRMWGTLPLLVTVKGPRVSDQLWTPAAGAPLY